MNTNTNKAPYEITYDRASYADVHAVSIHPRARLYGARLFAKEFSPAAHHAAKAYNVELVKRDD